MADDAQYVKLPDGSYGKFPGDASDDQIRSFITQRYPEASAPPVPKMPQVPMQESTLGKVYGAGRAVAKALPEVAPYAAAIGAGMADPFAAPITAPLAYGATRGLISPKAIQEHPVAEGLTSASMAIPGPMEAVGYAFPRFAVEHPGLIKAAGAGLGTVAGGMLGEKAGGGRYGELGGAGFGALAGYRLAGSEVGALGEKLIQDTLRGARPLNELPERLVPAYMREARAIAKAQAELALERGESPEMLKIPSGGRSQVEKMYEERARMNPELPRVVLTPEEIAESEGKAAYSQAQKEAMRPAASTRGMAHAAGEHSPEWMKAKRGTKITETKSFRLQPKRALPIVPPE